MKSTDHMGSIVPLLPQDFAIYENYSFDEDGLLHLDFLVCHLMRWVQLSSVILVLKYNIFCDVKCEFISQLHAGFPECSVTLVWSYSL